MCRVGVFFPVSKRLLLSLVGLVIVSAVTLAATTTTTTTITSSKSRRKSRSHVTESARAQRRMVTLRHSRAYRRHARRRRHRYYEHFYTSSFADNVTAGDITTGEDPIVRAAAIDALGNMNGTVVAIDPTNGRILTMVNQELALSEGAPPCSTIKVAVALAALHEGVITRDTPVAISRRHSLTLSEAIAHSNNAYFEAVGRRLGFERVKQYANLYGLGELAGYNIEGEHLGIYPDEPITEKEGGVGKMCSFGEGISMTPLQLGALMAAIANGGTLYYLQHPTTPEQIVNFHPVVKRTLDIAPLLNDISDGMSGAVQYGTARLLRTNFTEAEILGKTGTCSKDGTRFGWFASYSNTAYGKIVTVIFLRGGWPTYGPKAAEIAGKLYEDLYSHSYFVEAATPQKDTAIGISH